MLNNAFQSVIFYLCILASNFEVWSIIMAVNNTKEVLTIGGVILATLLLITFVPKAFSAEPDSLSSSVMEGLVSTAPAAGDGVISLMSKPTQCEFKKEIAKTLMTEHQNGSNFRSIYSQLETDFSKKTMSYAWQTPVQESAQAKQIAIDSFSETVYDECVNGKKSVHLDH